MTIPITGGTVLAFFDFLKRFHPGIHDLQGLGKSDYYNLVDEFVRKVADPPARVPLNDSYISLTKQIPPYERDRVFARLQKWSGNDLECLQAVRDFQDDFAVTIQ